MSSPRPGLRPVLASTALHLVILAPIVAFTRTPRPMEFQTIRITLVSAAAPIEATQPPPPVPEPEPEPEPERQPEPEPERPPEPERRPEPEPERRPEPQRPPQRPRPTPPRTPPAAQPTPGADGLNIQTEGIEFPFPEYANNVVAQIHRYFRWTEGTNPRATIYFEIMSDGSIRGLRLVRSSGNIRFDFAVQGAVETAANRGAFGPLPDAFVGPSLPIQLEFEPPR